MPKTLADWLTYLESLHPKTIALGLERVAQVKQRLNLNPKEALISSGSLPTPMGEGWGEGCHSRSDSLSLALSQRERGLNQFFANFPVIIVGGTNGKGSVCAMLESILHAAGYRVGCYTSPHLLDYNERVRIGKRQASDAELCASFEKIEQARKQQEAGCNSSSLTPTFPRRETGQERLPPPGEGWDEGVLPEIPLTYFEFGTLAAMQCFIEHQVDVAILEVGLGGRLDAVNVFDADVSVVTSIDIDHTDYLGDTREQIAFEKAGIFRAGKVAVFGDRDMPQAIRTQAEKVGAELWCIGEEYGFVSHQGQWDYRGKGGNRSGLPFPALRGAYQLNNASAVLAALDALKEKLPVSMEAVRRGLVEVTLSARFQMIPGKPTLILDVAHNPHAARSLAKNLAALPPCRKTYAVIAMLKDKDMAGVIEALKLQVDVWLVAGISAPRGATAAELGEVVRNAQVSDVLCFPTITEALHHAYNQAGDDDRIAALGSFYTVAEVMRVRGLRSI